MTTKAKKRATPKADGIDLQPKTFKAAKEVIQLLGREVLDGRAKLQNFVLEHEEVFSDSNRLRARNAELVEQITSVNKGSESLIEAISYWRKAEESKSAQLWNTTVENKLLHEECDRLRQEKKTVFDNAFAENENLRKANEYASKRLATYEAQFGFLPDELEEVEPLAAVTGNWADVQFLEMPKISPDVFDWMKRAFFLNESETGKYAQPKPTHNDNS